MAKLAAEFLGALILVFFGCGAVVMGGAAIGQLGVALSFGFAIVAIAYGLGPVSGGHVNPAVSLAVWLAGRMTGRDMLLYWAAQVLGAIVGAGLLAAMTAQSAVLGQNGWAPGESGGFGLAGAAAFETAMTAIFVMVILGATSPSATPGFAGLAIGLTLAAIHIIGIGVTGVSVNPARSLGPALLSGGEALAQAWLFVVAPMAGAAIGALLFRYALRGPHLPVAPPQPGRAPETN